MSYGGITGQTPNMENVTGILPVENGGTGTNNLEELLNSRPGIKWVHKSVPANGVILGPGEYFPVGTFAMLLKLNGTYEPGIDISPTITIYQESGSTIFVSDSARSDFRGIGTFFYPIIAWDGGRNNFIHFLILNGNSSGSIPKQINFSFIGNNNGFTVPNDASILLRVTNCPNMPNADFYWLYFQP